MAANLEDVLDSALKMSPEERALIAERLLSSLDNDADPDVEQAWQEEVQRRVRDVEEGRVECIPWESVRNQLRRSVHGGD